MKHLAYTYIIFSSSLMDWQDKVLRFPEDIVPPAFMWRSETSGEESALESRSSVIQSHYEKIREYLKEEGYADLALMSDRLETRQSRLEERLSVLESRLLHLRAQQTAFHEFYGEIESSLGSRESEVSESPRETTIGEALLDEYLGLELSTRSRWRLDMGNDDGTEKTLTSMRIAYRPSDDEIDHDLQTLRTDFDSADLYPSDALVFTGDKTWEEVFDRFEDRLTALGERKSKIRRTLDLLGFRHGIVETVLYQIEAFGKPEKMNEGDAQKIALDQLPDIFEGRPILRSHAGEIVKKYRNEPTSLPEKMGPFKENWVPSDKEAKGVSKVSQLQRAIWQEDLSDDYNNPETFCTLLERLVERHDTAPS